MLTESSALLTAADSVDFDVSSALNCGFALDFEKDLKMSEASRFTLGGGLLTGLSSVVLVSGALASPLNVSALLMVTPELFGAWTLGVLGLPTGFEPGMAGVTPGGRRPVLRCQLIRAGPTASLGSRTLTLRFCIIPYCLPQMSGSSVIHCFVIVRLQSERTSRFLRMSDN